MTKDNRVGLCDFGLAVASLYFATRPPPIYLPSHYYCAKNSWRTDIFELRLIVSVLLSERFP
jgi:hypothetical protein